MRTCFHIDCTSLASLTCYSTDFLFVFLKFDGHRGRCKLDSEDAIFQLVNIGLWIQHTQIP